MGTSSPVGQPYEADSLDLIDLLDQTEQAPTHGRNAKALLLEASRLAQAYFLFRVVARLSGINLSTNPVCTSAG